MAALWHHFFKQNRPPWSADVVQALSVAGVCGVTLSAESAEGGGVIFFDQVSPELCDFVRHVSRDGLERVLAIASPDNTPGHGLWHLLESGAADVFAWDHSSDPVSEVVARFERWALVDQMIASPLVRENLVGRSRAWIFVLRQIVEMAMFTDASVLITGESGTGKELLARLVHTLDTRPSRRDLVVLDCTTVVPELSGSEFFGHERGAFTGAVAAREGAFAMADGGTLFLDEVGELPLPLQAELLRVVQERTYKRVGGNQWQRTTFRLVCATNRDLIGEEALGRFRRDFYYRIAGCICRLPALRERPEDILALAQYFLRQFRPNDERIEMDDAVRDYLLHRDYPGNVRDLRQLIARISYRHVGTGPLTAGDLPVEERPRGEPERHSWRDGAFDAAVRRAVAMGTTLKEISQAAADTAVRAATEGENGNVRLAARRLGVTERALQMRRAADRVRFNGDDPCTA